MAPPSAPKDRPAAGQVPDLSVDYDVGEEDDARTQLAPRAKVGAVATGAEPLPDFSDAGLLTGNVITASVITITKEVEDPQSLGDPPILNSVAKSDDPPTIAQRRSSASAAKRSLPLEVPSIVDGEDSDGTTTTTARFGDAKKFLGEPHDADDPHDGTADTTTQQRGNLLGQKSGDLASHLPALGSLGQTDSDSTDGSSTVPTEPRAPHRPPEPSHVSDPLMPLPVPSAPYVSLESFPKLGTSASSGSIPHLVAAVDLPPETQAMPYAPPYPAAPPPFAMPSHLPSQPRQAIAAESGGFPPWNAPMPGSPPPQVAEADATPTWPWIVLVAVVALFCISIPILLYVLLHSH